MPNQVRVPDYEASPRQTLFHTSSAEETLYGGAAGGGKTAALVAEAVTYSLENQGARVYIFRKTLPEIEQSIAPEIYKQCGHYINAGHMTFNGKKNEWTFKDTGSVIRFAYLQHPSDMYKYQSAEIHLLIIDELTHFTQDEYEYLKTRVRGVNSMRKKIMAATNPGGIGHGWVKNQFIDAGVPETVITEVIDDHTYTRMFIPAKVTDHPDAQFRKDYEKVLTGIKDPDLRRALRDGDWDVFAGQAFTEWRRTRGDKPWHVVEPFAIPDHWVRWQGYDYGYNTYAAALWFAKDPQSERVFIYREFYESKMGATKQGKQIILLEGGERVAPRLADPSIWKTVADADTGELVATKLQKAGLNNLTPANNNRIAGKNIIHEMLDVKPDGLPAIQVFSSCVNLIRTLPSLPYDKFRVEDIDTKAEDHLYDALRYGLMSQRSVVTPKPYKPKAMMQRKYGNASNML